MKTSILPIAINSRFHLGQIADFLKEQDFEFEANDTSIDVNYIFQDVYINITGELKIGWDTELETGYPIAELISKTALVTLSDENGKDIILSEEDQEFLNKTVEELITI